MIHVRELHLKYGDKIIFDGINLVLKPQDKVGLIGMNGAGKTSLLKFITGELAADAGVVEIPPEIRLAYLRQHLKLDSKLIVIEETLSEVDNFTDLQAQINQIQEKVDSATDYHSDTYLKNLSRLAELHEKINLFNIQRGKAEVILKGLGFKQDELEKLVNSFSGGWQMRIELAKVLIQEPDYILLDEPSNYLDIESVIWFEQYLNSFSGAFVVISHDEDFLNNCTSKTIELSEGKVFEYNSGYSQAMEERGIRIENQKASHANQQKIIQQKQRTIDRFRAKASKRNMVKSMEKQLAKMDLIEVDKGEFKDISIRFNEAPRSGEVVLDVRSLSKSFGNKQVFTGVEAKLHRGEKIAFVGKNGEGKSTLVNIISGKLEKTGGRFQLGHNVMPGYYFQDHPESLEGDATVYDTLEANAPGHLRPRLRGILGAFLFSGDEIEKKVKVLSGGEKSRLALASLLMEPYNFLILDEPTNHLDIPSKRILKSALQTFGGSMLVVSHDRQFLRGLTSKTWEIKGGNIHQYLGDIDYFLEAKNVDSFRDFERSDTKKVSNQQTAENKGDREELKKLRRKLQYVEREIEKIESAIAKLEEDMSVDGFFEKGEHVEIIKNYDRQKALLDEHYSDWESISESIIRLDG